MKEVFRSQLQQHRQQRLVYFLLLLLLLLSSLSLSASSSTSSFGNISNSNNSTTTANYNNNIQRNEDEEILQLFSKDDDDGHDDYLMLIDSNSSSNSNSNYKINNKINSNNNKNKDRKGDDGTSEINDRLIELTITEFDEEDDDDVLKDNINKEYYDDNNNDYMDLDTTFFLSKLIKQGKKEEEDEQIVTKITTTLRSLTPKYDTNTKNAGTTTAAEATGAIITSGWKQLLRQHVEGNDNSVNDNNNDNHKVQAFATTNNDNLEDVSTILGIPSPEIANPKQQQQQQQRSLADIVPSSPPVVPTISPIPSTIAPTNWHITEHPTITAFPTYNDGPIHPSEYCYICNNTEYGINNTTTAKEQFINVSGFRIECSRVDSYGRTTRLFKKKELCSAIQYKVTVKKECTCVPLSSFVNESSSSSSKQKDNDNTTTPSATSHASIPLRLPPFRVSSSSSIVFDLVLVVSSIAFVWWL